jgi:hypothetical protein
VQERYEALLATREQQLQGVMLELQRLRGHSSGGSTCSHSTAGEEDLAAEAQARRNTPVPTARQQHMQQPSSSIGTGQQTPHSQQQQQKKKKTAHVQGSSTKHLR